VLLGAVRMVLGACGCGCGGFGGGPSLVELYVEEVKP